MCVTQTADDALTRAALRIRDAAIIEMDVSDSSVEDNNPVLVLSGGSESTWQLDAFTVTTTRSNSRQSNTVCWPRCCALGVVY